MKEANPMGLFKVNPEEFDEMKKNLDLKDKEVKKMADDKHRLQRAKDKNDFKNKELEKKIKKLQKALKGAKKDLENEKLKSNKKD